MEVDSGNTMLRAKLMAFKRSVWALWYRLKGRVASVPATVWVPAFAALIGALSAFVAVWAIRLYRRDTRPVYDVD